MEYDDRIRMGILAGGQAHRQRPDMPSGPRPTAFTLIELIAVMAIIALLTTLAVVGFTRTSRGRAIQAAVSDVHSALSLARQQAIAKGVPVIFLVCDRDFGARSGNAAIAANLGPARGQAYAILDAQRRQFLQSWTDLPAGTVFDSDADALGTSPEKNILNYPASLFTNIPFPSVEYTNWSATMPGIAFRSDGSLFFRSSDLQQSGRRVYIVEGLARSGGVTPIPSGQSNAIVVAVSGAASVQVP